METIMSEEAKYADRMMTIGKWISDRIHQEVGYQKDPEDYTFYESSMVNWRDALHSKYIYGAYERFSLVVKHYNLSHKILVFHFGYGENWEPVYRKIMLETKKLFPEESRYIHFAHLEFLFLSEEEFIEHIRRDAYIHWLEMIEDRHDPMWIIRNSVVLRKTIEDVYRVCQDDWNKAAENI